MNEKLPVPHNEPDLNKRKQGLIRTIGSQILRNRTQMLPELSEEVDLDGPFIPEKEITPSEWKNLKNVLSAEKKGFYIPNPYVLSYLQLAANLKTIFPQRVNELEFDNKSFNISKKVLQKDYERALIYDHQIEWNQTLSTIRNILVLDPDSYNRLDIDINYDQFDHLVKRYHDQPFFIEYFLDIFPNNKEQIISYIDQNKIFEEIKNSISWQIDVQGLKSKHPDMLINPEGNLLLDPLITAKKLLPNQFATLDLRQGIWRSLRTGLDIYRQRGFDKRNPFNARKFAEHAANMTELAKTDDLPQNFISSPKIN